MFRAPKAMKMTPSEDEAFVVPALYDAVHNYPKHRIIRLPYKAGKEPEVIFQKLPANLNKVFTAR